jgi:hypothetical protein
MRINGLDRSDGWGQPGTLHDKAVRRFEGSLRHRSPLPMVVVISATAGDA